MAFAGMPTWMHFISAFYSLMYKSFIPLFYTRCACARRPKCHMIGRPTVARRSADRQSTRCMLPDREMQSCDHRATVGRMENFVVVGGNRWGMFSMWQFSRPINIKNQVGRLSILVWRRYKEPQQNDLVGHVFFFFSGTKLYLVTYISTYWNDVFLLFFYFFVCFFFFSVFVYDWRALLIIGC